MIKKVISISVCVVLILSLVIGCGKAEPVQKNTPEVSKSPEKMVKVNYFTYEAQELKNPIWDEIRKKLNIDVQVKTIVDSGGTDKETQLDIIQMSGADMDVRIIQEINAPTRIQKGFAMSLNDLIKKYNVNMEGMFGPFLASVKYGDQYYGIPVRANMQMYFYNKDIFDKAGVPYPKDGWTWDECMSLAKRMTSGEGQNKIYGFAINSATLSFADPATVGGATFYGQNDECNIMNPLFKQSLEAMRYMDANEIKPSYSSMRSRNSYISVEFLSGKVAIAAGQGYMIRDMKDKKNFPFSFKVGTVYPPVMNKGDNPKTLGYTAPFLAINPNSANKDEAFQAMMYYLKNGTDYITSFSIPPVTTNDKVVEALMKDTPLSKEDVTRFVDPQNVLKKAGIPGGPGVTEYTKAVNEEVDLYLTNAQDSDTTFKKIKTRADKAIADAKAAVKK